MNLDLDLQMVIVVMDMKVQWGEDDSDDSYEEICGVHDDVVGTRSSDAFWSEKASDVYLGFYQITLFMMNNTLCM